MQNDVEPSGKMSRRTTRWLTTAIVGLCVGMTVTSAAGEDWAVGRLAGQSSPPTASGASDGPRAGAARQVRALLINGGGRRTRNFQSHFLHVKELVRLLVENGVPRRSIVVFASDGLSPGLDLAVRDVEPEADFWMIEGIWPGTVLGNRIRFENSVIKGVLLRPATKLALRLWFEHQATRLRPGDTLFIYVTDHGVKNSTDLDNNRIVLWGDELSVGDMRKLLAFVDPGVRVVTLMSQCFSGSFANLMTDAGRQAEPAGNVCGYFAATADRFAYGCYPENRGKEQVGHSFRFLEALDELGGFTRAHERVLVTDNTPDVPHRTSDVYAGELLDREAAARGIPTDDLVDELLQEAWTNTTRYRRDVEILDRVADAFGTQRPRSLTALAAEEVRLRALRRRLRTYAPRWNRALTEIKTENVERFVRAHAAWRDRLAPELVRDIEPREQSILSRFFLEGLVEFADADFSLARRLSVLRQKAESARAAKYRMEVRLGTLLRMRTLLTRIAGRVYLDYYGVEPEKAAFASVVRCEETSDDLAGGEPRRGPAAGATGVPRARKFPPLTEEAALVDGLEPGWLGIAFGQVEEDRARRLGLERGAVRVLTVHTGSPAERAGIEAGDIVVGPPGAPFVEPYQIREWSMLAPVGKRRRLETIRDGQRRVSTVRIGPYPVD